MFPSYAELHCLTNFSFLRGASHPEELVDRAIELGYSALAITDECSVAGVVRAHAAAKKNEKEEKGKIKIIVGAELTLRDEGRANPSYPSFFKEGNLQKQIPPAPPFSKGGILGAQFESCNPSNAITHDERQTSSQGTPPPFEKGGLGGILRIVLLATSREGYGHLCELITRGRRQAKKGEYRLTRADLDRGVPGCLALWLPSAQPSLDDALWLGHRFPGNTWIAVELLCGPDDRARLEQIAQLSEDSGLPLVAAGDVHMHVRSRRTLQDTLTAIRLRRSIKECGKALFPSGERHLRPCARLGKIYPPELLIETLNIAERCDFSLDSLRYEYPEELVPPGETPTTHLRALTEQGLKKRFPGGETEAVRAQVEKELALIAELQYEPFFLTVHDIVQEARRRKILCQGRGSAANSIVCYALEITAAGPGHLNMLFERFISKERNEPPDIDVDFEHERREEIIQYIYQKYGRDRAALAATVITYRRKSALRDVGKALGFDLAQVDRMAKNMAWWDGGRYQAERLRETGLDPDSPVVRRLIELVDTIVDFPRHLSQHVGGFVISRGPLSQLVPTENAAMPERTVIQWEKNDLEELGLLKVDVLALGMLTAIRRAIDLTNAYRGTSIDKDTILASEGQEESIAVYDMICNADTVGVFQIESREQMSMLPRLRPRRYYDLVIEVAIVRPGPIQGGMVHPYLNRRQTKEAVSYPPRLQPVLERTLGVPIFQEQVIQIAMVAADFTPGEADQLRRAMAAWHRKGGLGPFEDKLKQGMRKNGYSEAFAQQI
ncbi:MAG TPA: error-prone DNA polymerase, partial [Burkholderiales bacterium]|nr:error-prone DNA polymerase [Burkholderiales bacterium]